MTGPALERPPRLPFVLTVGVTGHRREALGEAVLDALPARIGDALAALVRSAALVHAREPGWFAPHAPRHLFVSPLADGADQVAAGAALAQGFALHAILPFARDSYRGTLPEESRTRFDTLIERSDCLLALPGSANRLADAYAMAGRATVAHCDLLIAVWDGLPARGRGGTADVVALAIARGTPVVHVPVDEAQPVRLLWSAFDPAVVTQGDEETAERPFDEAHLDQVLEAMMLPPRDPQEQQFLQTFFRERLRRIRARIEYPLLLAAAGVRRFKAREIRESHCAAMIEEEWRRYREGCATSQDIEAPLDLLERSYSWSDRLATHFAQTHRSGHIFNFVLGGLAVCLGLSAFMAPQAKLAMAMIEFAITLAIIVNTKVGMRNEWHRRWLDYRQLAERLRPMRSLKLLGIAAPDPPGSVTNPVARRWIDWYASGVWRAMGCPAGSIDSGQAARLAEAIAAYEVAPQVAYHQRSARQIDMLDHRLEQIASMLFKATLVVCVAVVVGLAFESAWLDAYSNWFTLISAGFPALGTAVFGIRFQGDFGGSALRSQSTADALGKIDQELRRKVSLNRAADLVEQAARTMLADLDEWRLINQQHDLSIG